MKGRLLASGLAALAAAWFGTVYGYAPKTAKPGPRARMVLEIFVSAEPTLDPGRCTQRPGQAKETIEPDGTRWAGLEGGLLCRFRPDGINDQQWRVTTSRKATHKVQAAAGRIHFSRLVAPFVTTAAESGNVEGRPCSASPLAAAMLADSYLQADLPLAPCRSYRSGNIVLFTDSAPTEPVATPLLRFRRADAGAKGKTIVYLTGGPFEPALQGFEQSEILKYLLMERSDVAAVVVPLYAGASYTYLEGVSNFDLGIAQVSAVLARLNRKPGQNPVCVVGGSLGGRLGAHLAGRHPETPFLLVNPPIWSLADVLAHAARTDPTVPDRTLALRRVDWRGADSTDSAAARRPVVTRSAYESYFGPHYRERLGAVLGSGAGNVSMAYSTLDDRIGVEAIGEVRLPPDRLVRMTGVGHIVAYYDSFWAFRPHLERFVDRCGVPAQLAAAAGPAPRKPD